MTPSQLLKSRGILETALEYGWLEQVETCKKLKICYNKVCTNERPLAETRG